MHLSVNTHTGFHVFNVQNIRLYIESNNGYMYITMYNLIVSHLDQFLYDFKIMQFNLTNMLKGGTTGMFKITIKDTYLIRIKDHIFSYRYNITIRSDKQ